MKKYLTLFKIFRYKQSDDNRPHQTFVKDVTIPKASRMNTFEKCCGSRVE
jgi:hypothetical protein